MGWSLVALDRGGGRRSDRDRLGGVGAPPAAGQQQREQLAACAGSAWLRLEHGACSELTGRARRPARRRRRRRRRGRAAGRNRQAEHFLGITYARRPGRRGRRVAPRGRPGRARAGGHDLELSTGRPAGRSWCGARWSSVGGRQVGAMGTIEDVTERRRLEAMRTDFVANISHELKTPVGALALLAETLVDEDEPEVVAPPGRADGRPRPTGWPAPSTTCSSCPASSSAARRRTRWSIVAAVVAEAVDRVRARPPSRGHRHRRRRAVAAASNVVGDRRQLVSAVPTCSRTR